ncbi:O-antigen ligase family protein [Sanguibacter inulinus]|uniref:O-antigen ligase family protein n=1 Tax=Sanguibacter inulinus TaxID=60922 RepID=A0A853ETM6_9MICO|nr:O-antigen ligase family protein [Sanguibacter inulinus]MBF0722784.1 O-antigen ligase family protein [Sanguibacter inulinus]NYS93929.1 O-antigen ligase family protein [Sanguibacter inulinus]
MAIGFFLLSHPRELFPSLTESLWRLAALSLVVVVLDLRRVKFPAVPWTVAAFLGICLASALWSVEPSDTLRAVRLYCLIAVFACLAVANSTVQTLVRGIVWGALLVAGATFWTLWLQETGAQVPNAATPVAGFHGNRNVISYTLVLGICALLCFQARGLFARVRWTMAFASMVFLLLTTRSGTGIVAAVVLPVAAVMLTAARRWDPFGSKWAKMAAYAVVVASAAAALATLSSVAALLGRRSDLSGRGPLWDAIVEVWSQSPWGGYGFGAVWSYSWFSASPSAVKAQIDQLSGQRLAHGHSILFDLLPQLGVLGVVAVVAIFALSGRWIFTPVDDTEYSAARWGLLGVLGVALSGFTEPMLAVPVGWFVVVSAAAATQRIGRRRAVGG